MSQCPGQGGGRELFDKLGIVEERDAVRAMVVTDRLSFPLNRNRSDPKNGWSRTKAVRAFWMLRDTGVLILLMVVTTVIDGRTSNRKLAGIRGFQCVGNCEDKAGSEFRFSNKTWP